MIRKVIFGGIVLLTITFAGFFLTRHEVSASSDQELRQVLISTDFAALISQHTQKVGRNSVQGQSMVGILASSATTNSDGDNQILSAHTFSDGSFVAPDSVVSMIAAYRLENGEFPANGLELVISQMSGNISAEEFSQLSDELKLKYASGGLNWYTGQFYNSFDGTWEPGGIEVREVTSDDNFHPIDENGQVMPFDLALKFDVMGDSQDEILYSDYNVSQLN